MPDEVAAKNLQQPLAVTVQAVIAKGYEPICFNQNLYAIDLSSVADRADRFEGFRHDAETLWLDAYYDQSDSFRRDLSRFRRTNPLICKFEAPHVSQFTLNV